MPKRKTAPKNTCTVCGKFGRGGEIEAEGKKKFLCKQDFAAHNKRVRKATVVEKVKKDAEERAKREAEERARIEAEHKKAREEAEQKAKEEAEKAKAAAEQTAAADEQIKAAAALPKSDAPAENKPAQDTSADS